MSSIDNNIYNFSFGGCDTVELAQKYGTPLYVISEDMIRERCSEIKNDFLSAYDNTKAFYASKAFLNLAMCKIIKNEGLGLDVVSGGELYTAIKADFPMENVIFHGNNKTKDELYLAINNNIGRIIVDNLYELQLIEEIAGELNKKVKVMYRVIPGVDSHTHKYIQTGQKDSKFGIPLKKEIIFEAVKKGMQCKNVELTGFHFHIGSQLLDNISHILAVEILLKLMRDVRDELEFITKELNTGGGYGIYYSEGDYPKPLRYFTDKIVNKVYELCKEYDLIIPTIMIEPGRWIVGEAGITLYTIGSIKEIPEIRKYIAVDGGMTDNPRPALYNARYDALIANKYNVDANELVTIAGKCCESGDVIIKDVDLPNVESGDILVVKSTGAYNYSMSNNYNKIPRPAVVMVNNGKDRLVVKRETYEDMLRNELF